MNSKPNFKLPDTKLCLVKYADNKGVLVEVEMETPPNSPQLLHTMLMKHRVGYGQIRAVKAQSTSGLKTLEHVNVETLLPQRFTKANRLEPMFS